MGNMIDMGSILAGAKAGSDFLTVPTFRMGMGASKRNNPYQGESQVFEGGFSLGARPEGDPGRVVAQNSDYLNLGAASALNSDPMGGAGGDMRSYVPTQDAVAPRATVPASTFDPNAQAAVPEEPVPAGNEEEKAQVEAVANVDGTIEQLLAALQDMASMKPEEPGNPVFQLDAQYKNSSALGGMPGTVAQYPTAGSMTRETDYNLGAR